MRRRVFVGVLAVLLLGVTGATSPPATAGETATIEFVGQYDVGPGVAWACMPAIDLSKCPVIGGSNNSATVNSFSTTLCVGGSATVLEPKPVVSGPNCSMAGWGAVHGYCGGPSTGTLQGSLQIGTQSFSFFLSFVEIGLLNGLMFLSGSVHKQQAPYTSGTLTGTAESFASGGNCLNKDAKTFTIAGSLELLIV